jgi:hypothetical protein
MKTLTIQGVPYSVNDKNEVFVYQSSGSTDKYIHIGMLNTTTNTVELFDTWQDIAEERLAKYRECLKEKTEAAMAKAREIQGVTN